MLSELWNTLMSRPLSFLLCMLALMLATVVVTALAGMLWPKSGSAMHRKNRAKARALHKKLNTFARPEQVFAYLRKIDPFVFEELLLASFSNKGYKIIPNQRYTGDGGVDGRVYDEHGNLFLIQAKRYKSAINPAHVHDFAKVVAREKAHGGLFVHTGRTGQKSREALANNIEIISGNTLLSLILG